MSTEFFFFIFFFFFILSILSLPCSYTEIFTCFSTQDVPLPTATRTISVSSGRLNNQETSPDSTSRIVNNEAGSRNNPANDDEEELMFVERSVSPCQPKLRLQKGRLKRNRYTEV